MSYIKLFRSLLGHPIWTKERFTNGQAWVDILLSASYADHDVISGSKVIPVRRGEVLTSQVRLAARWRWDRETVKRFLASLEALDMIHIRTSRASETGYTMISLVNWDTYQPNIDPPLPQHPASDAATDPASVPHIQERKEGKKKKTTAGDSAPADKKPLPRKPPKEADPNVKLLVDHYHGTFLACFQSTPPHNGAKSGAIAKKILSGRSLEEAKWLVTEHLTNPPDFYEQKNLYGLEYVLKAAPTLLARKAKMHRIDP